MMAISEVQIAVQPVDGITHFECTVQLDSVSYLMRFYTNTIDDGWYMDIESLDGTSAVRGIAMVCGVDLLFPYRYQDLPQGPLWIKDHGLDGGNPSLQSFFDKKASLRYLQGTV